MSEPFNAPYRRRFNNPAGWESNYKFADWAVERTRERINELSWEFARHQVADEVSAFLRAEDAREQRRRAAQADGLVGGEPGE